MNAFPYIALRNHTPYSLLEGAIPIAVLLDTAIAYGMPALAIADSGHLFGAMEFALACQKKRIHPIIGCQLSLRYGEDLTPYPIVLYAQTQEGYSHLCQLVSASTVGQPASLRGQITADQLARQSQGLLLLTGGAYGPLDQLLEKGQKDAAQERLTFFCALFPERIYIEINRYEAPPEGEWTETTEKRWAIENQLVDWAYAYGLPLIATNQALFLRPEDHEAQDALRCIALNRYLYEEDRPKTHPYHYFRPPQEMAALFQDLPEALANTHHLMKRCSFLLRPRPPVLPSFPCTRPEEEELRIKSQEGLAKRLELQGTADDRVTKYQDRLVYECEMIVAMGFAGYFLIVADFIQWAKGKGIPVGPGRGSGAGSIVAWALSITDVDPLQFHLVFERFLNPERVTLPDFDVDFCQDRRDEVIAYVRDKYGADHVAHIITFGTLQARAVLRDVGRVLQMPYPQVDKICKLIPQNPSHPVHLQEALQMEPQLVALSQEDEQVQKLLDIGLKLEGLYRHASTHAAGVIISRDPLSTVVPLYQDEHSLLPATEYSMKYVESAGLIKFDFLGLKTLTVLQTTVRLVAHRGIELDLSLIPLDDGPTFALLRRVETVGLFQLEGMGMSEVLRQLRPEDFKEIIALVALYRPGPMDDIPRYLACRHGLESVTYTYPCLKDILEETFGVMVYQEQVLQIARTLAGYTLGKADLLRRAMGKKIQAEMEDQRKQFVDGVRTHGGGTEEKASQLFDQIAKFAGYAFPKAHATPYALLSYHTAYCKANYPAEFMTALMIHDFQNTDKLRVFIREAKRMNIPLFPPDVNTSQPLFSVTASGIRYGLAALKGVGVSAMEKVMQEREAHGPFLDIMDFVQRTSALEIINKKNLESLIASGAFDSLHPGKRSSVMASVDSLLRTEAVAPSLLFTLKNELVLKETPPWSSYESLAYERRALGFYLTAHPLDGYTTFPFVLCEDVGEIVFSKGKTIPMMGMVMEITEKLSKSGQKYAFLHLSDPTGNYEVTVFSDLLRQSRPLLSLGVALALQVSGRRLEESTKLSATKICLLEDDVHEDTLAIGVSNAHGLDALHGFLAETQEGGSTTIRCTMVLPGTPVLQVIFRLGQPYRLTPALRSQILQL